MKLLSRVMATCTATNVETSYMTQRLKRYGHNQVMFAAFILLCLGHAYLPHDTGKKRKLSAYISDVDSKLISANSLANPCRARGLRGLYNMGQTCFMSVVLQSLIHNPFIRAYYLAESHRSSDCERESCTSCALDDIFTEFHSVEKAEGYGAVAMLQASWKGGGSLAGYQQQDAHEYLQFILNSLHSANTEDEEKENQKAEDCDCVIHQTFCGLLRSTVTCSKCKNVTTAVDPFMDLSLDLKDQNNKPTNHSVKKKLDFGGKDGKDGKANSANGAGALAIELTECLDRFTSAEALLATDYKCTACDSQQNATKRMSLSRLPPVLPIHLKRFSHSKSSSSSVKLDDRVKYPTTLDLRPYTSKKNPSKNSDKKSEANGAPANGKVEGGNGGGFAKPIYELSSVIVHKGKMDSGHYVSYARIEDEWFLFDDSKVVLVDEREVLNTEPYMLFYIIREFDAE